MTRRPILLYSILLYVITTAVAEAGKPTKVFILAGQSNMQGHARVETFDYMGDDPKTAPLLKRMRGDDGQSIVCDGAWISYLTGSQQDGVAKGKLTAGFGARRDPANSDGKIGPEFTFGIKMDDAIDEPVVIIKTAWGGKSLFYDFRPPSAGVFPRSEKDIEREKNLESKSGHYYRAMIRHVQSVLADLGEVCPDHQTADGFELAGFVWFQGFNDMVNSSVYPRLEKDDQRNRFAEYSELMAQFIRDVRNDLKTPDLPFVIGVMGVGGATANPDNLKFREAMAAPAKLPDFVGNVTAVPTSPFWDEAIGEIDKKYDQVRQLTRMLRIEHKNHANKYGDMTKQQQLEYIKQFEENLITADEADRRRRGASNGGYHYLGSAKTMAQIGDAFADAVLALQK